MSENRAVCDYEKTLELMHEDQQKLLQQLDEARAQIVEQSRAIAFLEGQVNAFQFCVSRGGEEK